MYINLRVGISAQTCGEGIAGISNLENSHEGQVEEFLGSCGRDGPVGAWAQHGLRVSRNWRLLVLSLAAKNKADFIHN